MELNGVEFYVVIGVIVLGLCALIWILYVKIRKRRSSAKQDRTEEQEEPDEPPKKLSWWQRIFGVSSEKPDPSSPEEVAKPNEETDDQGKGGVGTPTGPVGSQTSPVGTPTGPVGSQTSLQTSPVGSQTSPVGSTTGPVGSQTSPVGSTTGPVGSQTSPVGSTTGAVGSQTSPVGSTTGAVGSQTSSQTSPVGTQTSSAAPGDPGSDGITDASPVETIPPPDADSISKKEKMVNAIKQGGYTLRKPEPIFKLKTGRDEIRERREAVDGDDNEGTTESSSSD
jgi:hypothetical protein